MRKNASEQLNKPRIGFTKAFDRQRKTAPQEIRIAFNEALSLFLENQQHPQLRNHPLQRKLTGYRSIDVNGDWRALFKVSKTSKQQTITFHKLGTHKELYKK